MGKYKKVGDVSPDAQGKKLTDGTSRIKVKAIKESDGFFGLFYIVEFFVMETDCEGVKEGEQCSWTVNLSNKKAGDAPFQNIKAFMCAVLNVDFKDKDSLDLIGEKMIEATLSSEQPFEGVELSVQTRTTGSAPNLFVKHRWETVDEDTAEVLRTYMFDNFAEAV
jgi:hypothetical protein